MEWTQQEPSGELTLTGTTERGERVRLSRYGAGCHCVGQWNWLAGTRHCDASGIRQTREEAQAAIDAVLPILREASEKIAEALALIPTAHDREAVRALVAAEPPGVTEEVVST